MREVGFVNNVTSRSIHEEYPKAKGFFSAFVNMSSGPPSERLASDRNTSPPPSSVNPSPISNVSDLQSMLPVTTSAPSTALLPTANPRRLSREVRGLLDPWHLG